MPRSKIRPVTGQQYTVTVPANTSVPGASPNVPQRKLLIIQNTGANSGNLRFDNNAGGSSSDFIIMANDMVVLSDNECPSDRLNFFSLLGTTFAVYEGTSDE